MSYQRDDKSSKEQATMLRVNDFLFSTKIDHINLFELCDFIQTSGTTQSIRFEIAHIYIYTRINYVYLY